MKSEVVTGPSDGSNSSRYAWAYESLRTLLMEGRFPPNTRLTEAELTKQLGVSRGTLRTVLVQLAQEGYIANELNKGARTRSFSVSEAAEILETREVLESALAAKAAERATPADIEHLATTAELMRAAKAADDRERYSRLNRQFHAGVCRAAHNPTLASLLESLVYPLVMRQYRNLQAPHPRTGSFEEHQAIYAAILTHNPEAAAATMRHHVSSARRALLLTYRTEGEPGTTTTEVD